MNLGQECSTIMDHHYQPQSFLPNQYHQQDPLGIVVYNDLPDGATCFNRTLARESARSCPPTSCKSVKTLQNHTSKTTAAFVASRTMAPSRTKIQQQQQPLPENLRPQLSTRRENFLVYETVDKPAQYLGSFPVRAVDQSTRANLVRKQLSSMKDVPTKRSVLINISLEGIKVCCPKGQNIYSSHGLQRISYATCDPAAKLLAFLAREPHAPLHLQHCHVFKTSSGEQAEDLNTLIGNAFRIAYATQIHDEHWQRRSSGSPELPFQQYQRPTLPQSRSVDSLLSPEDLGIMADLEEPVYETPDFSRSSHFRHSEQTFRHKNQRHGRLQYTATTRPRLKPQPPEDFSSIQLAPMDSSAKFNSASTATTKSKFKPNSLPVLNCLFAALGKNNPEDILEDNTPYADFVVPDLFSQMNNNQSRLSTHKFGTSLTHDDLRTEAGELHSRMNFYCNEDQPRSGLGGGGETMQFYAGKGSSASNRQLINKSKSAHVISCEVYSEVADHTEQHHNQRNATSRRPGNWNVDTIRQTLDTADLIVSPGCTSSRNGSSGFSSGEASTNSSATTPPPILPQVNENRSILEEAELRTAPWFQDGMPRDLSLEVLKKEPEGSFIVRASNSKNGLALSVRVPLDFHPEGIVHYLIIRAPKGFRIKGCLKQFPSVTSLLIHHSVMPEMLPCPLLMNRYNNPAFKTTDDVESNQSYDEDPEDDNYLDPERDYELIHDLRRFIMTNHKNEEQ